MMFFIKGLILGFSVAAPVGPIGVLCIRRSLAQGLAIGFASGLGAALADSIYGVIAAFGIVSVSKVLVDQIVIMKIVGSLFLLYLGAKTFIAKADLKHSAKETNSGKREIAKATSSTFFLTITNPMTILSFAAAFSSLGINVTGNINLLSSSLMVAGVFIGSAFWWLFLSTITTKFKKFINENNFSLINKFSGFIIFAFGMVGLLSFLKK